MKKIKITNLVNIIYKFIKKIYNGEFLYLCNNKIIDIHSETIRNSEVKKAYKKKLTLYKKTCETEKIGEIKLNLYNPYDINRFDINNPKLPSAGNSLNNYEKEFLKEHLLIGNLCRKCKFTEIIIILVKKKNM